MESKTAEGLIILFFIFFIILFPIGSWIWGLKFWFLIIVAGGIALSGMVMIWIINTILGVGRWAKRQ